MRIPSAILALLLGLGVSASFAKDLEDILVSSQPLPENAAALVRKIPSRKVLFIAQFEALERLKGLTKVEDPRLFVATVVPYLDYRLTPSSAPMPPPSRGEIEQTYPAFAALVTAPGIDEALAEYATSPTQAINLRLAALAVLRTRDPALFATTEPLVARSVPRENPQLKKYLEFLRSDRAFFWGIPQIPTR